jgi:hypothetical protein
MFKHALRLAAFCVALVFAFAADEPPISTPVIAPDNSPAAIATARKDAEVSARRDIEAGTLRIILLTETIEGPYPRFDRETNYPHYIIPACEATPAFEAAVEAYNGIMKNWHANGKR